MIDRWGNRCGLGPLRLAGSLFWLSIATFVDWSMIAKVLYSWFYLSERNGFQSPIGGAMRLTHRELSAVGGAGAYRLKKALELGEAFGQARERGGRLVRKGVTTTIEKPGPASSSIDIALVMHLYLCGGIVVFQ